MATKKQAINELKKHCSSAALEDDSTPEHYSVQLEAPIGHHWDGDVHCRAVHWFAGGNKVDFWDFVIEEIKMLPDPRICNDADCEGISSFGECEYWL